MPFNTSKFNEVSFTQRTADVSVPALGAYFDEGEPTVFTVRGLTFAELCLADNAADRSNIARKVVSALSGGTTQEQAEAIQSAMGFGGDTPPQMAKRIEMLVCGSVSPAVDRQLAVRLSEAFPVEFKMITDKIVELTGQGQQPGKQSGSGVKTPQE